MWLICLLALALLLALTVALALCAEVIAEHGAENKVLLGGKFVEWTCDDETDGFQTFAPSEIDVDSLLACGL